MSKEDTERQARDKAIQEFAKAHAPKPPTNCPYCNGEREADGTGGAICHFCRRTTPL